MESIELDDFVRAFVDQYRAVHLTIRDEISALDADTLGWAPCEGANSIAILVTHLIGSEIEAVRTIAGLGSDRVRSREFEVRGADAQSLLSLVDRADENLDELAPRLGSSQLGSDHVRPGALDKTPRRGVYVLMHSLAHAREHLGQLMLTKQLAEARR